MDVSGAKASGVDALVVAVSTFKDDGLDIDALGSACDSEEGESGGDALGVDMMGVSVLKSSPVRFFAFFGCNRTETGPKNSVQTCNRNHNHMRPVACGCMSSCDWLQWVAHQTSPRLAVNQRYAFNFVLFTDY